MSQSTRLLLLDSDADSGTLALWQALEQDGWTVDRAHNFAEAAELVTAHRYKAAVIEMLLPDMLGTDAWTSLSERDPELVGILVTSSRSIHRFVNATDRNVLAYLLKPLRPSEVCDLLAPVRTATQGVHSQSLV